MFKALDSSQYLIGVCLLTLLVACVPIGIGVLQQVRLERGISDIEESYSVATRAREVLSVVSQSMPSFTASALDLTKEERSAIFKDTDKYLKRLGVCVKKLIRAASTHVPPEKLSEVTAVVEGIAHSWDEIRRQNTEDLTEGEKTYHFLKIFSELQDARILLTAIERDANRLTQSTINQAFDGAQQIQWMLIFALCGGAFLGFIALISNYLSARSTRVLNARLDAAISNLGPGLCMFDGRKRLIVSNERYATLYGLERDQMHSGITFREILEHRIENEQFAGASIEEYIQERISAVEERCPSTKVQKLADGRFIEIVHRPLPAGGWLATHEDITERRHAEDELVQHRDHLQDLVDEATDELRQKADDLNAALEKEKELNQIQRQFVSMASHEFRTPLSIIDSIAQGLKRRMGRLTPEEASERVDQIRDAVKRMVRLMESTLTAARMEEGKVGIEIDDCDLGALVRTVCERQSDVAPSHRINCQLIDFPDTIKADAGALDQVLTNVLTNAVKYSPDAPEIDVVARREGDEALISVTDRGLGIGEEDLPRMFERFFRAKTSTGIAGTGIGLNLALTLVKMHGGTIAADSTEGVGSTFTIRLPIDGSDQSTQSVSKAA